MSMEWSMNGRVDNNGARSRRGTIVLFVFLSLFPKHRTIIAKNLLAGALNFLGQRNNGSNNLDWRINGRERLKKKKKEESKRIKEKKEKNYVK